MNLKNLLILCSTLATCLSVKIKMGILLSGSGWSTGNDSWPGAELAIKEINENNDEWKDIEIEHRYEISNCSDQTAFEAAHALLYEWKAQVIIGPACTTTCIPVSLMAQQYDVPVISYGCSGTTLSDRDKYPNFGRTAETLSGATDLLKKVFKIYEFKLFSVITTTGAINVDFAIDFVSDVRDLKDEEPENSSSSYVSSKDEDEKIYTLKQLSTMLSSINSKDESVRNGTIDQIQAAMDDAWVFFIPMYDSDADFLLENAYKYASKEFDVDRDVWKNTNFAWFRYQTVVKPSKELYYDNVFSLENDNPEVTYKDEYASFLTRMDLKSDHFSTRTDNLPLYLAYMYNSVKVWATALNMTYEEKNKNDATGGFKTEYEHIIKNMKNIQYQGAYRKEILDEFSQPKNAIWVVRQFQGDNSDMKWHDVIKDDPKNSSNVLVENIKWPGDKVIDPCKDGRCNTGTNNMVLWVVVAVCIVLVIIVVVVSMFIVYKNKQTTNDEMKVDWKIAFSELDFAVKKSISGSRKLLGAGEDCKPPSLQVAKYGDHFVVVENLNVSNITISKEILEELCQLKQLSHPNLNTFYGLCDDPGYCSVITAYCSKGSLQDLIHNDNVHLDWMFKLSLIIDVAKGLKYLQTSTSHGCHGNLRTSMCVVDSHWVCKLTAFGLMSLEKETSGSVTNSSGNQRSSNVRDLFYKSPEMLWPCTKERSVKELQKCDTYSLSVIMYELFSREQPYDTSEILPEKIINKIRNRESPVYRPSLDMITISEKTSYELIGDDSVNHAVPAEAIELMKSCWAELPFERNNMSDTVIALEDMNPDRSLSITDRVVKMMEKYSEDLENKVAKKTQQLQNQQAGRKLCRFLPKKIIEKIENGMTVDRVTDRQVTGVCVKVKVQGDIDEIAAINDYESFNGTEIEARNLYQVIDSDGHPIIVSGLDNEENPTEQILNFIDSLTIFAKNHSMILKVAIHSGSTTSGIVMADTSHPRLCLTGSFPADLHTLLLYTNYGDTLISQAVKDSLPDDVKSQSHVQTKLSSSSQAGISDTYLLYSKEPTSTSERVNSPNGTIDHSIVDLRSSSTKSPESNGHDVIVDVEPHAMNGGNELEADKPADQDDNPIC